ncbi:hypothetical protein [Caenimonas aquaedulcis]|uniref:Uncharacterized protein n=1 Tax=Caenimonas aquaedulcis TaxID=2793270 RepID=A0A931MG77_9BURK|nr:hypothetical protein [Caenimonas aquaedulcis]MBG9387589.1 hypothetical protein [Caenimonas aquaedulcis]
MANDQSAAIMAAQEFLTDVVRANATAVAAITSVIILHQKSANFNTRSAADAIVHLKSKVPAKSRNEEAIRAVYDTFLAALRNKPEESPAVIPFGSV